MKIQTKSKDSQKENQQIEQYLKEKSYMIIDPNNLLRVHLKKFLAPFKMRVIETHNGDKLEDIINQIKRETPDFVFCYNNIQDQGFEDILNTHTSIKSNRLESSFFLIADDVHKVLDPDIRILPIDGFLIPPFSFKRIEDTCKPVIKSKAIPKPERKAIYLAAADFYLREFETALEKFQVLLTKIPNNKMLLNFLGKTCDEMEDVQSALNYFKKAVEVDPKYFQAAFNGLNCAIAAEDFQGAYHFVNAIKEHHKLSAEFLEPLIRVSLASRKYSDIFEYEEMYSEFLREGEVSDYITNFVVESLIECAQEFHKRMDEGSRDEALKCAAYWCNKNLDQLRQVCMLYLEGSNVSAVEKIIENIEKENFEGVEKEIFVFEIETFFKGPEYVISEGPANIKNNIKNEIIYENVIKAHIEAGRKRDTIEDLVYDACKDYPDKAEFFNIFLSI